MKFHSSGFLALVSFVLCAATACGQTADPLQMRIPEAHPRLWWTEARLAAARTWVRNSGFRPGSNDYVGQAMLAVTSGDANWCRRPVEHAMQLTLDAESGIRNADVSGQSNGARWYGETVILIYDWCWDTFTASQRDVMQERWNRYIRTLNTKYIGGLTMPQNNYFWGYFRNQLEWIITTWGENPEAQSLLDSVRQRWETFVQHTGNNGRGGVPHEGSQYGRYLLDYSVVPLSTAGLLGADMYGGTDFFRSAVLYILYSTTPQPTKRTTGNPRYELFSYGDDQDFRHGGSAEGFELGNFMTVAASIWRDSVYGRYARTWLNMTRARRTPFVAAIDQPSEQAAFDALPVDYYAPGTQMMFIRNRWGADATSVQVQFGDMEGHGHLDMGNWQIWRKGQWLSRETSGYSSQITGPMGPVDVAAGPAHNILLVNGKGPAEERNGLPVVKRLESRPAYAYIGADLTPAYRNDLYPRRRNERDNPAVASVSREVVFIRPLETLVIFDRVQTSDAVGAAAAVRRSFVAHFEQVPEPAGSNRYTAQSGDQALDLTTLLPAAPTYNVVAEGGLYGQQRLEVEGSGERLMYFLHVLQARDAAGEPVQAQVTDAGSTYIVVVRHSERGTARLVLEKGATIAGGSFGWSSEGDPEQLHPLTGRVQEITVGSSGPVWQSDESPAAAWNPSGAAQSSRTRSVVKRKATVQ